MKSNVKSETIKLMSIIIYLGALFTAPISIMIQNLVVVQWSIIIIEIIDLFCKSNQIRYSEACLVEVKLSDRKIKQIKIAHFHPLAYQIAIKNFFI